MEARPRGDTQHGLAGSRGERLNHAFRAADDDTRGGGSRSNGRIEGQAQSVASTCYAVGGRRQKVQDRQDSDADATQGNKSTAVGEIAEGVPTDIIVCGDISEAAIGGESEGSMLRQLKSAGRKGCAGVICQD